VEKIDLKEINKMVQQFRRCHRAAVKLREGDDFSINFDGYYNRSGAPLPVVDEKKLRDYLLSSLESELTRLRKRFGEMGIDPVDISRKKKKTELKVA
jgi:hypothetical protein